MLQVQKFTKKHQKAPKSTKKHNLFKIYRLKRPVLNFLFFSYNKILQVQKSTKQHQKATKSTKKQNLKFIDISLST